MYGKYEKKTVKTHFIISKYSSINRKAVAVHPHSRNANYNFNT